MMEGELKEMLRELMRYVGYASCHGTKCRLPHCHDCNYPEDVTLESNKLDLLQARIREALK